MDRILRWIGTLALLITAAFFSGKAKKYMRRASSLTEKEIEVSTKQKKGHLKKADELDAEAKVNLKKSRAAKDRAVAIAKQLEDNDATNLAESVRRFNDRL